MNKECEKWGVNCESELYNRHNNATKCQGLRWAFYWEQVDWGKDVIQSNVKKGGGPFHISETIICWCIII